MSYRSYATITRDGLIDGEPTRYDCRVAADFIRSTQVQEVIFATPRDNDNTARYRPLSGQIVYVKSTAGKYGKPVRIRRGSGV